MAVVSMKQLLEAGVHFGHQTRRWNPKMAKYIFTERNGIYIIDLQKTVKKLDEAYNYVKEVAAEGGDVFGESDGNNMYVWVVEDNKVHKRKIVVNAPTGEAQVLVSEGLKPGEQIVIAGVYQLVEGESIKSIDK